MNHSYVPRIARDSTATYLLAEQSGLHRCAKCGRGPLGHIAPKPVKRWLVIGITLATLLTWAVVIHHFGLIALLF